MRHARFTALAFLLALAGCAGLGRVIGAAFEKPRLIFVSWEPREADLEGATIALSWRLENPNGVGVTVSALEYRLDVEGHQAVTGAISTPIAVPSRGTAPVELPVRVRYRDVPGLVGALFEKNELRWGVSGRVGIDTPVGVIQVSFSHEGRVPAPRPPRLALAGLSVHDVSLDHLTLDVRVEVRNDNLFPFPVGALSYGLRIAGSEVASGASHPLGAVGPGKSNIATLPVRVSFSAAGAAARRAMAGEPVEVLLKGTVGFAGASLPVELRGTLAPGR